MKLTLTLPFPPSANSYWRAAKGRGLVPSDKAIAYKRQVAGIAAALGVRPLKGPVAVVARVFRQRRAGDLDNSLKVLFDALSGVAWLDDEQVSRIEASRSDDAKRPRVELEIEGEQLATIHEAAEVVRKRLAANQKRKQTIARGRVEKFGARPSFYAGSR